MAPSTSEDEFRAILRTSKRIIVIAGAGLSAASGIPTFRGAGGLWRSLDGTSLATPGAFKQNPSICWQFYHYRREKALTCEPNDAHRALAQLSIPSLLKKIAPQAKSYHLIISPYYSECRWAISKSAGIRERRNSKDLTKDPNSRSHKCPPNSLLEMHGKIFEVRCTSSDCTWSTEDFSSPLCPALGNASDQLDDIKGSLENESIAIPEKDLPHCPECGSLARPGVVWFGETPRFLSEINLMVFQADLCLVVGTSSTVYPAAGYASRVLKHGGKVAIFNLEGEADTTNADFTIMGPCEVTLPRALGLSLPDLQQQSSL